MSKERGHRNPVPTPSGKKEKAPVKIGDYEVISTLGHGSFGKVKLAKHSLTGIKVALKYISKRKISNQEMANRVHREIQYLSLLRHPHIIKLYDVVDTPSDIVMVIEYLSGELFEYIVRRGKMPEDEARRFFQQIMGALDYCHSHNIVHRDLKPENLLLDEHLNVKIADFGLSNIMRDGDFLKTSCGSPNYAAPEVISGKLYAGPEIDIWSCGVILYVMLCGRLPFDDDHIPLLFKKINGGIFSLPPYLSPEARHLLSKMLLVDSNKRIKLYEIRQLPWFQKNLPAYLFPHIPSTNAESSGGDDDAEAEPEPPETPVAAAHPNLPDPTRRREWISELGIVDQDVVDDLCQKISGLQSDDVWRLLKSTSEADADQSRSLRIAYQLCRDNKRMLEGSHFDDAEAQQSFYGPKSGGNGAGGLTRQGTGKRKKDKEEKDPVDPAKPLKDHTIRVLDTSVRRAHEENPLDSFDASSSSASASSSSSSRQRLMGSSRFMSPLKQSIAQPLTPTEQAIAPAPHPPPTPSGPTTRRLKQRWHFGIRSRSEPMEVMLEIYRTLKALNMEWKPKHASTAEDAYSRPPADEDPKKRRRREEEERVKKAQELFFVETRCKMHDVIVRMDLQLYRVDEQNYLVDFRNVGYHNLNIRREANVAHVPTQSTPSGGTAGDPAGSSKLPTPSSSTGPNSADSTAYTTPLHSPMPSSIATLTPASTNAPLPIASMTSASSTTPTPTPRRRSVSQSSSQQALGGGAVAEVPHEQQQHHHQHQPAPPQSTGAAAAAAAVKRHHHHHGDVSSPYLFLECAVRLIVELASPGAAEASPQQPLPRALPAGD